MIRARPNLGTMMLLATELRSYPRSISLDAVVLVRFRRAREALWAACEPAGALDGIMACSAEEVARRLQACVRQAVCDEPAATE